MGKPEAKVEDYLVEKVEEIGGVIRKLEWVGRSFAPDRFIACAGRVVLVETKAKDGKLSKGQKIERERLLDQGADVRVIHTRHLVDDLISELVDAQFFRP